MADYAPNYTARYKLHYTVLGHAHVTMWRIERGTSTTGLALMVAKVRDFLDVFTAARFTNWTEQFAEYAPEDVDFFVPAALPGSAAGTATIPTDFISQSTLHTGFCGRSSQGQKARLFLYGVQASPEATGSPAINDNFRITTAESSLIASAVTELNSGGPTIVASDNNPVTWYSYANTKYNDHWVNEVRG